MKYANQTPSANQTPASYGDNARRAAERSDRPDNQAARRAAERSDSAGGHTARTGNTRGGSGVERFDRPAYTTTATAKTPTRTRSTAVERTDRPKSGMGWLIPLLLVLLIAAILFAVFGRGGGEDEKAGEHVHDYYLSEYQEATEAENGYQTFVCSGCGASYTEVIPKLAGTASEDSGETDLAGVVEPAQSKETPLKDMFVFDKLGRENSYIIDYFNFDDDTVSDSYGNSYHGYFEMLSYGAGGGMDSVSTWATLLANGEYSRFTGTVFAEPDMSSDFSIQFLVFADGTQVYDSGFLTRNDPAVSFDIDVSGARQVKVQAYSSDYSFYNTNPRIYLVDAAFHR